MTLTVITTILMIGLWVYVNKNNDNNDGGSAW